MLRRLHAEQPAAFEFTPANLAWAQGQIAKYPAGRQASAIIPLLWRAQEQEGWLTRPAIESVARMLDMAYIRALEVATFYFMFQLQPVGSLAHVQVCGTLSCMLMGAEDLVAVCERRIAPHHHELSADGRFSWEEVECLGSCANAPMVQIGKDYYEDLTPARLEWLLDELAAGRVPVPGPQNGRYAAEPLKGLTSLTAHESGRTQWNASVELAVVMGDTIMRIDGTAGLRPQADRTAPVAAPAASGADRAPAAEPGAVAARAALTPEPATGLAAEPGAGAPLRLTAPRGGRGDDLKRIVGIGPRLEALLQSLGFWHFDQIAAWSDADVAWVDSHLGSFRGRVTRDHWVDQAGILAAGGSPDNDQIGRR